MQPGKSGAPSNGQKLTPAADSNLQAKKMMMGMEIGIRRHGHFFFAPLATRP